VNQQPNRDLVFGRKSIPPERLLRALLLQAFYSILGVGARPASAGSRSATSGKRWE
jgi:hypothetical protein